MSDLRDEVTGQAPDPEISKLGAVLVLMAIAAVVIGFLLCPDLS